MKHSPSNHECAWKAKQSVSFISMPVTILCIYWKKKVVKSKHLCPSQTRTIRNPPQLCRGLEYSSWDPETVQGVSQSGRTSQFSSVQSVVSNLCLKGFLSFPLTYNAHPHTQIICKRKLAANRNLKYLIYFNTCDHFTLKIFYRSISLLHWYYRHKTSLTCICFQAFSHLESFSLVNRIKMSDSHIIITNWKTGD